MWQFSGGLNAELDILPLTMPAQGGDWAGAAPIHVTAGFCVTRAASLLVVLVGEGSLSAFFLPG